MTERIYYRCTIPEKYRKPGTPAVIHFTELTGADEETAIARCGGVLNRIADELCKASLALFDGKPINRADGDLEAVWNELHPKARHLIKDAFNRVNLPTDEERESFFLTVAVEDKNAAMK